MRLGGIITLHPIWYRHWLELRYRLLAAGILALLASLYYPLAVQGLVGWLRAHDPAVQLHGSQHLLAHMSLEQFVEWALHFVWLAIAISLTGFLLAEYPVKAPLTLALPVSRIYRDLTRFLAGWFGAAAVTLGMSLLHLLTLAIRGDEGPGLKMLATWAFLCALLLPVLALQAACNARTWSAILLINTSPFIAWWSLQYLYVFSFHFDIAWLVALIALAAAALIFAASLQLPRWREL